VRGMLNCSHPDAESALHGFAAKMDFNGDKSRLFERRGIEIERKLQRRQRTKWMQFIHVTLYFQCQS
jgi:hypothetical protein